MVFAFTAIPLRSSKDSCPSSKDTFKTAKAKFIVPVEIEDKFIGNTDIEQMCLLGLGMPQPILLISLSDIGRSRAKEKVAADLERQLATANEKLAAYKKVSNIVVIPGDFTVENGMLTPTLKIKRNKVHEQFKDQLASWAEQDAPVVFA